MILYIKESNNTKVIVVDRRTGYAVAEFYYQPDKNGKPLYDAVILANEFIHLVNYNLKSD